MMLAAAASALSLVRGGQSDSTSSHWRSKMQASDRFEVWPCAKVLIARHRLAQKVNRHIQPAQRESTMPNTSARSADGDQAVARIFPPDLLSEAQSTLATLADIECRYETLSHHVDNRPRKKSACSKALQASLRRRQRRERQRAVKRLTAVHSRISKLIFDDLTSSASAGGVHGQRWDVSGLRGEVQQNAPRAFC